MVNCLLSALLEDSHPFESDFLVTGGMPRCGRLAGRPLALPTEKRRDSAVGIAHAGSVGVAFANCNPERHCGELIAGKYELVELLGEGGMGAIWKARHVLLDTQVALK